MSRLDDQLRKAFKREQPSAKFVARVLDRVATQPAPQASWWRRLATLLEPPRLRWVAIGVTAALLLAIGAAQVTRLRHVPVKDDGQVASTLTPSTENKENAAKSLVESAAPNAPNQTPKPETIKRGAPSPNHRAATAERQKLQELKAEAEAAKEKLMLALYIASAALNDAQKAVHDDGPKP